MDRKSILKEIKKLINFSGEQVFKDAKLVDGETIVKVDAENFEVGLPLFVVTPEGLIPAPAGEHVTQDGIKIVVDEAGVITSVEEGAVQGELPAAVEAQMSDDTEDFYTWDQCMLDMMDEYGDEQIASAVCGKIKADGYIMSKEEAITEGLSFVENTPVEGATASEPTMDAGKIEDKIKMMEDKIAAMEKMMNEMLPAVKQAAEFGNSVIEKLDNFVKETPAEVQFSSIKSEYKQFINDNKNKPLSGIEGIKNIRSKKN